jgi:hypothetical protein
MVRVKNKVLQLMGVKRRPEDDFKKKFLIPFLETIKEGFIDERTYQKSGYYSDKPGIPDVYFGHHSQWYAFETKSKTGKASKIQKIRHEEMRRSGIIVIIVNEDNFEATKEYMLANCKEVK